MDRRTFLLCGTGAAASCASRTAPAASVDVRFDYSAVELLGAAYERASIDDDDLAALLANRGVNAMVANTIKYVPQPVDTFGAALREYVRTRNVTVGRFGLVTSGGRLVQARAAMAAIRDRESELAARIQGMIAPLWPRTGVRTVTCHFVLAGASDGFVLDTDARPDVFVALDRTEGAQDVDGVVVNVAHEAYHAGQKAARAEAGLFDTLNVGTAPPLTRLLLSVLDEGSANYAVDPTRMSGQGPYFDMWRTRFIRNNDPSRVGENFALFDRLFNALATGTLDWPQAYAEGFSGTNDARLYFVGYQMTRLLHNVRGQDAVRSAFGASPAHFFQEYILASRASPQAPRFSADTERQLLAAT